MNKRRGSSQPRTDLTPPVIVRRIAQSQGRLVCHEHKSIPPFYPNQLSHEENLFSTNGQIHE